LKVLEGESSIGFDSVDPSYAQDFTEGIKHHAVQMVNQWQVNLCSPPMEAFCAQVHKQDFRSQASKTFLEICRNLGILSHMDFM
jgi:hypothetical protein